MIFLKKLIVAPLAAIAFMGFFASTAHAFEAFPLAEEWQPPISLPGNSDIQLDTDMDGHWVGMWCEAPTAGEKFAPVVARSVNNGQTWSAPSPVWTSGGTYPSYMITSLAAGDNGVWLATLHRPVNSFDRSPVVIKSADGGLTWSAPQDLSQFVPTSGPLTTSDYGGQRLPLQVGYCGNSCWMALIAGPTGVVVVRSTNNGATWAVQTTKPSSTRFVSKAKSTECLLMAATSEIRTEPQLSHFTSIAFEFSHDNGATFGPPLNYVNQGYVTAAATTDGAGKWIVAVSSNPEERISLLLSVDGGTTFSLMASTPVGFRNADTLAFSKGGDLVVFARELRGEFDSYPQTYYGYTTRTSDLGQTWTPWKRIYSTERFGNTDRYVGGPVDVEVDTKNNFVAAGRSGEKNFWDIRPEEQPRMMQVFRFQGTQPAVAAGWELYE